MLCNFSKYWHFSIRVIPVCTPVEYEGLFTHSLTKNDCGQILDFFPTWQVRIRLSMFRSHICIYFFVNYLFVFISFLLFSTGLLGFSSGFQQLLYSLGWLTVSDRSCKYFPTFVFWFCLLFVFFCFIMQYSLILCGLILSISNFHLA